MKAEKGLEPVAQTTERKAQVELIEESANEFPLELRQRVRDAMMNAWVGGYNECLDEESSHHERVSPEEEAAVEAALAHPPIQVEPVASKSVEDCMRLAFDYRYVSAAYGMGSIEAGAASDALQAAIVAYGDAQWNAAIEAAANACEDETITGSASAGAAWRKIFSDAVRALKREAA